MKTLAGLTRKIMAGAIPNSLSYKEINLSSHTSLVRYIKKSLLLVTARHDLPTVCHDDRLLLRGLKHNVGLDRQWWRTMPKTGEIIRYWNPRRKISLPADTNPVPPGFRPISPRQALLAEDIFAYARDAYVDVRITDLWFDLRSRYTKCLDVLEMAGDRGILEYHDAGRQTLKGFSPAATKKRRREAFRRRLRSVWCVAEYEHDLLILDPLVAQSLLAELAPYDTSGHPEWSTIYLKGFVSTGRGNRPIVVKVYDTHGKHGAPAVKIEVTLRSGYLKYHKIRTADRFAQQPDIQLLIEKTLRREWRAIFSKASHTTELLAAQVRASDMDALLDHLAARQTTLTEITKRQGRPRTGTGIEW